MPHARSRPGATEGDGSVPSRLIRSATRLFAEHGFDHTSVQQIVDAAQVTKGALYHYFDSKDDLLYEVYHRVLALQMERLERFVTAPGPVAQRLRAAAADVVETSLDNLDDMAIFFREMHRLNQAKREQVRAERRRYHERFRSLIEEGQAEGVFRTDVPADIIVDYFFGAVHHLAAWWHPDGPLPPEQVGGLFAELLLSSLRSS